MGSDAKLVLAIRTIAVTTRVAVRSNAKLGRTDLIAPTARRGLELLDSLGPLGDDTSPRVVEAYEAARAELLRLNEASSDDQVALSIADDGTAPEHLDVRPKLRP